MVSFALYLLPNELEKNGILKRDFGYSIKRPSDKKNARERLTPRYCVRRSLGADGHGKIFTVAPITGP
jgi:hypothetical protein